MSKGITVEDCRVLFCAVIERAILDAEWNPDNSAIDSRCNGIPRTQMLNARSDALRWLRGRTDDFREVCERAGLHPDRVKRLAAERVGEDLIWGEHFQSNYFLPKKTKLRAAEYFGRTRKGAEK